MNDSSVLPHGNFEALAPDLWIIEGSLPHNNPLPRTMTVFRYPDGRLWIHSPITLNAEKERELVAFGTPTWVVVPNSMHRLDVGHYKLTWSGIRVICPKEARKAVEEKAPVDEVAEVEFRAGPVKAVAMAGVNREELAYELTLEKGSALVVNDLLVNTGDVSGTLGWLLRKTGRTGVSRVPGPQKIVFLYARALFRHWLLLMARKNFSFITLSHGKPVTRDTNGWLLRAAQTL